MQGNRLSGICGDRRGIGSVRPPNGRSARDGQGGRVGRVWGEQQRGEKAIEKDEHAMD